MTLFTRSLWPETTRWPYVRLALGLVVAPLLLAAVLSLIAFLIAGSSEPDRASTLALTRHAAGLFFVILPGFSLTLGIAGVAALWALGRRGLLAWLVAGAVAGAIVVAVQVLLIAGTIAPAQAAIELAVGLVIFALIRWIAGVRHG